MVWTLFNRHSRKFRKRSSKKSKLRSKINGMSIEVHIRELLVGYKSPGFVNILRACIMSLPTKMMTRLTTIADDTIAVTHFDSFDFATLYTNIPHDLLGNCLDNLIKEAYRVRGATYISVGRFNAFWSDKLFKGHANITVNKLIEYIMFLINNIYVRVGNRIFKQTIGIPMGTDCTPLYTS